MIRKLAQFFFFGNYFLGLCIAMLSFETVVQHGFYTFNFWYFLLVAMLTVVYYTHAYASELSHYKGANIRTQWYATHRLFIARSQRVLAVAAVLILLYFLFRYHHQLSDIALYLWGGLAVFPVLACLYYRNIFFSRTTFTLRNVGVVKPFVIGFVATGAVTVYPLFFYNMAQNKPLIFDTAQLFYFLANFLFTTVIAIMFDIKDYAADHNHRLKTWVVRFGLRRSIFYLLLPLVFAGWLAFVVFAFFNRLTVVQTGINSVSYVLLASVAWSLQQRKKILYYLAIIDGLLLVKAVLGIAAVVWFDSMF